MNLFSKKPSFEKPCRDRGMDDGASQILLGDTPWVPILRDLEEQSINTA